MSSSEQACPSCGRIVETAGLEPFGKLSCPACGFQMRVERVFENYQVVEPLGTGGMGSVYKACDTRLQRFVALKLLRKEFADDKAFSEKLQEEARITASIKHPHVVEVFSVGNDRGQFYVVMELVDGGSLDDQMEDEKRIPEMRALDVGLQVAKGLQAALQAGLIHRDIKPGNILFADPQTAKIVDFGLAALAEHHTENDGEIWGTPYYVAPERLTNSPEDFRSDLYSLGATLFHAIAGRPTFENETLSAAELKKLKADPVGLREVAPDVSAETAAVIDRMLRPEPADRHRSYKELIDELQAARAAGLARDEATRTRWSWPKRVLVSLGGLALAAAAIVAIDFGLKHRTAAPITSSPPVVAVALPREKIEAMRRELDAGHYAVAEAGFREISVVVPELEPIAELAAGLQVWERGSFAQATPALQKFLGTKSSGEFAWINNYRPLAQNRLDDYQLYRDWEKRRAQLPNDPEIVLAGTREAAAKLKTKGVIAFRLADEQATLVAQTAAITAHRKEEEKKIAIAESPTLQAAELAARKMMAAYRFEEAVAILQSAKLTAASLAAERDDALRRAQWLADWKTKLINDLNRTGYGGAVTDIHGVRYDGPVREATANEMELKTRYGRVMTNWLNLSPQTLLTMSIAFIRPGISDNPERQWLCAIFAAETGQTAISHDLAKKAAAANPGFGAFLPRFFPGIK